VRGTGAESDSLKLIAPGILVEGPALEKCPLALQNAIVNDRTQLQFLDTVKDKSGLRLEE